MKITTLLFAALLVGGIAYADDSADTTKTTTTSHAEKHMDCSKMRGAKKKDCMAKMNTTSDSSTDTTHTETTHPDSPDTDHD